MILLTIQPSDDIQNYLNILNMNGGGILSLNPVSTFFPTNDIIIPTNCSINGNGGTIDFNHQPYGIKSSGVNQYSTGTITSITNGVNVVGSGTSWLGNVIPFASQLFINGQWMIIAAVPSNTTLVLAEGYDGNTVQAGSAYVIGIPNQNISLSNLMLENSTATAIKIDYARFTNLNSINFQNNNAGIIGTYLTELSLNNVLPVSCTTNGIQITNGGRYNWNSVNSVNNGGSGILFSGIRSFGLSAGALSSNIGSGVSFTNCSDCSMTDFDANANGVNGVVGVSGNNNITIIDAMIRGNTSDGVSFTASNTNCKITNGDYQGNGGYGINIKDNTNANNIILGNTLSNNVSGSVHDLGTTTKIRSNIGVNDN